MSRTHNKGISYLSAMGVEDDVLDLLDAVLLHQVLDVEGVVAGPPRERLHLLAQCGLRGDDLLAKPQWESPLALVVHVQPALVRQQVETGPVPWLRGMVGVKNKGKYHLRI